MFGVNVYAQLIENHSGIYLDIGSKNQEFMNASFDLRSKIEDPTNWIIETKAWPTSNITYPYNWNLTLLSLGFNISSPKENNLDSYQENLLLIFYPAGPSEISDEVSRNVNELKGNLSKFQLIESNETTLSNKPAYKIKYTYFSEKCNCNLETLSIFTRIGPNFYAIDFNAEKDKFSSYHSQVIEKVLKSIHIEGEETIHKLNKSGLPLNGSPVDLAVNPVTNKLYVAIAESRQVQVIDGSTDRIIHNISIGAYPNAITINPVLNRIFVASPETDIIYVIDGNTHEIINKIQSGPTVRDLSVDTNEFEGYITLIFVANDGNNSISLIDDVKGKVIANVETEIRPYSIGIDSIKNRAYVTTEKGVDIIDYATNFSKRTANATKLDPIPSEYLPTGIVVNANTSKAYITNFADHTVSVIDTTLNNELNIIPVGLFPSSIAFNPSNSKIYVSNAGNSTVTIIDSTIDEVNSTVKLDSIPYDVAVNPKTNMIYMANYDSKTVSTINGTTNKKVSALTFHVHPPGAGHIECNENKIPENHYIRIQVHSLCNAISNYGFVFTHWYPGVASNSTDVLGNKSFLDSISSVGGSVPGGSTNDTERHLNISSYGEYTAHFISLSPIIQVVSPFLSIGALISVILVAAVEPTFPKWRNLFKRWKRLVAKAPEINPTSTTQIGKGKIKKKQKEESKSEDSNILSRGDILTIDATVIIGVLIFLSFSEGFEASEQYQINVITASIVFPFAISAIIGVTKTVNVATRLMIAGFINLMISVILIAIMKL